MTPETYNFPEGYKGDTYQSPTFKLLNVGDGVTSGTLTDDAEYLISDYVDGDDFTNVGASENKTGEVFTTTGTTPDEWTNGSTLKPVTSRTSLVGAVIRMQLYKCKELVKTFTTVDGSITITSAANGEFKLTNFVPDFSGGHVYDLQITFSSGVVKTYFTGTFIVHKDITQN